MLYLRNMLRIDWLFYCTVRSVRVLVCLTSIRLMTSLKVVTFGTSVKCLAAGHESSELHIRTSWRAHVIAAANPQPILSVLDLSPHIPYTLQSSMVSTLTWKDLKSKIPSFYNSDLRFTLLRTICVFSIALLCTVPSMIVSYDLNDCALVQRDYTGTGTASSDPPEPYVGQYEVHQIVYSYILYGFTLLHHFTRWAVKHYMYFGELIGVFCTVRSDRNLVCPISSTSP